MHDIIYLIIFLLVGMTAGIGSGLIGIGGGVIYIPFLYLLLPALGVPDDKLVFTAIATSLFTALFSSGSSFYNHVKLKNVDYKSALLLASGSIITCFFTPRIIVNLNPVYPKIVLIFSLLVTIIKLLFDRNNIEPSGIKINNIYLFFFGALVGAIASSAGIGGGVFIVPILSFFFALPFKKAIGTSTFTVFLTLLVSSISYWIINTSGGGSHSAMGLINLTASLPMAAGAVVGARLGARLGYRISVKTVKTVFILYLIFAAVKIITTL